MKVSFFGFVAAIVVLNLTPSLSRAEHNDASSNGRGGESAGERCAKRVREAGCLLSNNDVSRIEQNVQECKQVTSGTNKTRLEVFLLKNSDKLVVFQTKGPGVPDSHGRCPVTKYTVDASGIKDVLIRGNKTWMISNDGQLYLMLPDQTVSEVMNSSGKSYSGITKIKGLSSEDDLHIIGKTFDSELSGDTLAKRKHRKLDFFRYETFESLFRDK